MGESQRLTRWVQGAGACTVLVHFLLIGIFWWAGWLGVRLILLLTITEWVITLAVTVRQLHFPVSEEKSDTITAVFSEFWLYCFPLIPYAVIGFAYNFADRWLLQNFAGSTQQAYYSVAFQFGAIAAIATSSILNIFWKEIAEAHQNGNTERISLLYQRISRGLFFIAATGAGLLIPWSEDILRITLGQAYVGGATVLAIMFFYPLHQSLGQISGALAYATGRVKVYVSLGMFFMSVSIILTYFVLASPNALLGGLGLGALGLAYKMVILQILSVNALIYYLARNLSIKFDWLFQPLAALSCLGAGYMTYAISCGIFGLSENFWIAFLVSGLLYLIMVLILISLAPSLAGLRRSDVSLAVTVGLRWLRIQAS
jgi:O-antigen/teichoic acid export membrane protein